jgi:hypothetical protein
MSVPTKTCANCGGLFEKNPNSSRKDWETRRSCSQRCASSLRKNALKGEVKPNGMAEAMAAMVDALSGWRVA